MWLLEYDLVVNFDTASGFFEKFTDDDSDLLAFKYRHAEASWPWYRLMQPTGNQVMRCYFSPIRLSASAVDHLLARRRAMSDEVAVDVWPNDEAFTATTLTADGFRCRDIFDGVATEASFSWSGRIRSRS